MQQSSSAEDTMADSRLSEATVHDADSQPHHDGCHTEDCIEEYHVEEDKDEESSPDTWGSVSSVTHQHHQSRDEVREIEKLIREETKAVRLWRWIVIVAMLLLSAGATTATYFFLAQEETMGFESSFNDYAKTVLSGCRSSAEVIRSTCSDFTDMMTADASSRNVTWPFYSVPSWAVMADNLLRQTESLGTWVSMIVNDDQRASWKDYVVEKSPEWAGNDFVIPDIYTYTPELEVTTVLDYPGPYRPVWQIHPLPLIPITNVDLKGNSGIKAVMDKTVALEGVVGDVADSSAFAGIFASVRNASTNPKDPYSSYYHPIFDTFNESTRQWVATLHLFIRWGAYFSGKLPDGVRGLHLVLDNTCNKTATWELVGGDAVFLNTSDLHDKSFDRYKISSPFNTYKNPQLAEELGVCLYTLSIFPSSTFEENYRSNMPIIVTCVVGAVFLSMVATFIAYDNFQRKRNTKVVAHAAKSNAFVTSLFPSNFRDRLLSLGDRQSKRNIKDNDYKLDKAGGIVKSTTDQILSFWAGNQQDVESGENNYEDKPIAELYTDTTIMIADITGFTAWSSVREPSQVFTLLETLFAALDRAAKKRGVSKVETVGDSYVAVSGLPEPHKGHALAITRFAVDTIRTVHEVVKRLEVSLGPDTGDLGIRIGLHSGVVMAGVLRGERARFQLFGDTVNTTARIESSGVRNKIHASKETADLLIAAGKGHWVRPRHDLVSAKGKGTMQTFWIDPNHDDSSGTRPNAPFENHKRKNNEADKNPWGDAEVTDSKLERLIDWQVDVFSRLLKQVLARRQKGPETVKSNDHGSTELLLSDRTSTKKPKVGNCLEEVQEIICLPDFEEHAVALVEESHNKIVLDQAIVEQLRKYIIAVAKMYRSNAFHNFEHACHVTMSVTKLLSRIVKPADLPVVDVTYDVSGGAVTSQRTIACALHQRTYGITSDPLTQFSMVFSALIHDVDHTGVPNATLIEENALLASTYDNKSVAEQNSINLAWDLLQDDQFQALRSCIYKTSSEYHRFRQLVVQTVLATDIVDQELKVLRNARWDRAFEEKQWEESPRDTTNRKATIVIEHLIQASDVAHTMQHWHVYRKWNENFFRECYQAYRDGRANTDPSIGWYKGELGFFDFYIIPLAKKLKKCSVFGVSSDEYLNYAIANRQEWEDRGQEVVEEMVQAIHNQELQNIGSVLYRKALSSPYHDRDEEKSYMEAFVNDGEGDVQGSLASC